MLSFYISFISRIEKKCPCFFRTQCFHRWLSCVFAAVRLLCFNRVIFQPRFWNRNLLIRVVSTQFQFRVLGKSHGVAAANSTGRSMNQCDSVICMIKLHSCHVEVPETNRGKKRFGPFNRVTNVEARALSCPVKYLSYKSEI